MTDNAPTESGVAVYPDGLTQLFALMLFPNDERALQRFLTSGTVAILLGVLKEIATDDGQVSMSIANTETIASHGDWEREVGLATQNATGGMIAGDLLLNILALAQHAPEHASVNKGIYLLAKQRAGTKLRDGTRSPASERHIRRFWSEYERVRHLWAAFRMYGDRFQQYYLADNDCFFMVSDAEQLREMAAEHSVPGHARMWRPPSDVLLPRRPELVCPELSSWTQEALKEYRAPAPRY